MYPYEREDKIKAARQKLVGEALRAASNYWCGEDIGVKVSTHFLDEAAIVLAELLSEPETCPSCNQELPKGSALTALHCHQ